MTYKKVGIAQDSNLRGDSVRIQEKSNPLDYIEFTFDGTGTQSYKMPSSAGTSGQVLRIATSDTLEWSTAVGPQGPIGPTGLPGSSGSSGSTGSSGSSGASGTSGSSGSSGANGTSGSSGSSGQTGQASSIVSQGTTPGFTILQFNDGTTVLVPDGATGSAGTDGTSGTSGSSGQNGTSGTSGISSTLQSFNTSGGFVNVTFLDTNGTTLVPIPVGADGSSGSSGSSGIDGVNGAAGSSGSSGSSGRDGVALALVSGQTDYIAKYTGATAFGTASIQSIGDQSIFNLGSTTLPSITFIGLTSSGISMATDILTISTNGASRFLAATTYIRSVMAHRFADGTAAAPSLTFHSDTDSGMFRIAENDIGFAVGGSQRFRIADTALLSQVPFRIPDGTASTPSLTFLNDLDTGIYRFGDNDMGFVTNGSLRFRITNTALLASVNFRVPNGSLSLPSLSFINDTNTGFYIPAGDELAVVTGGATSAIFSTQSNTMSVRTVFNKAVNHLPTIAPSVSGTYSLDMAESNMFILTLTASTTLDYTNAQVGSYVVVVNQNSTGGYALNLASGKFIGTTWSGVATASNAQSIVQIVYDGSKGIITSQKNLIAL